ncbi:MAG: hypothetical protein H6R18_1321 [Proteobacteria bacterium]|nr:hypothetical protein [Pseudomonadota bacterium]
MKQMNSARQSGFTLVEIAIVLVIIGLLLGGVLKGQEMIENSKVKAIVNDMKAIQVAYNGYIDRYKAIPGDESNAVMLARGWTGVTGGGDGNGVLGAAVAQTFVNAAGNETSAFWQALRGSGLLTGDQTAVGVAALPKHAGGGNIGVAGPTVYGQTGTFVCASGLTTKQAMSVDILIDGPLPANQTGNNIGSLRGNTNAANPFAPAAALPGGVVYSETGALNPWTVCMKIG